MSPDEKIPEEKMQNIGWLTRIGCKRIEGHDDEGGRMVIWTKGRENICFGYWPDAGDKLPYIIDLAREGFRRGTPETSRGESP